METMEVTKMLVGTNIVLLYLLYSLLQSYLYISLIILNILIFNIFSYKKEKYNNNYKQDYRLGMENWHYMEPT